MLGAAPPDVTRAGVAVGEPLADKSAGTSAARVSPAACERETRCEAVSEDFVGEEAKGRQLFA